MAPRKIRFVRCVTVGDSDVGKTMMLKRYIDPISLIPMEHVPTVIDTFNKVVVLDKVGVNLELGDIAGENFTYRPLSYRGADVVIVAFSLVNRVSYDNVCKKWVPELQQFVPGVPIVLTGTKLDLRDDANYMATNPDSVPVTTTQGEELQRKIKATCYIECSSTTLKNVKAVSEAAIRVVLKLKKDKEEQLEVSDSRLALTTNGELLRPETTTPGTDAEKEIRSAVYEDKIAARQEGGCVIDRSLTLMKPCPWVAKEYELFTHVLTAKDIDPYGVGLVLTNCTNLTKFMTDKNLSGPLSVWIYSTFERSDFVEILHEESDTYTIQWAELFLDKFYPKYFVAGQRIYCWCSQLMDKGSPFTLLFISYDKNKLAEISKCSVRRGEAQEIAKDEERSKERRLEENKARFFENNKRKREAGEKEENRNTKK